MKLELKVIPSSSRDAIVGWLGSALKVKVRAPPEKGRANSAVEALLTKTLSMPKGSIQITAGQTSSSKIADIPALNENELNQKLLALGIS